MVHTHSALGAHLYVAHRWVVGGGWVVGWGGLGGALWVVLLIVIPFAAPHVASVCVRAKSDGFVDGFHLYDIQ